MKYMHKYNQEKTIESQMLKARLTADGKETCTVHMLNR